MHGVLPGASRPLRPARLGAGGGSRHAVRTKLHQGISLLAALLYNTALALVKL
jgi:hypothetical protein